MNRVAAFGVALAFCLVAGEAQARNTIIRCTGEWNGWIDIGVDGRTSQGMKLSYAQIGQYQYSAAWYLIDNYYGTVGLGPGNAVLTYLDPELGYEPQGFDIEFTGIYAGLDVEVTRVAGSAGAQFVYLQHGGSDDPYLLLGSALDAQTAAIGEVRSAVEEWNTKLVFLGQSMATTLGLICGGLLWRTIVVAARLK